MKRISEMTEEERRKLTADEWLELIEKERHLMTPQEKEEINAGKIPVWMGTRRRQPYPPIMPYVIKCSKCKHRFYVEHRLGCEMRCRLFYPDRRIPEEVRLREDCEKFEEK